VVADDQAGTITFHLREPNPDFLSLLALPFGMVVPAGQPPATAAGEPPPGTGPYIVKAYVPGERLTLTRNLHFKLWSADAQPEGYPDRIDWRLGVDAEKQVGEVIAGQADIATAGVPPEALKQVLTRYPTQTHSYTPAATFYYFMNTQAPPFDDVRVRRALNYAVDRAEIVRLVGGDKVALITCQVFLPNLPGYEQYCPYTTNPRPGGNGPWTGPDMSRARQLIEDSGTAGMKITLDRPTGATNRNLQPGPAGIHRPPVALARLRGRDQAPSGRRVLRHDQQGRLDTDRTHRLVPRLPHTERGFQQSVELRQPRPRLSNQRQPSSLLRSSHRPQGRPCEITPRPEPGRRKQTLGTG
jgi:ABC-type transport system substrate-binding protein